MTDYQNILILKEKTSQALGAGGRRFKSCYPDL